MVKRINETNSCPAFNNSGLVTSSMTAVSSMMTSLSGSNSSTAPTGIVTTTGFNSSASNNFLVFHETLFVSVCFGMNMWF